MSRSADARESDSDEPMTARHFQISGMDCAEEVAILKRAVGPVVGSEELLSFDILQGRMGVAAEAGDVPDDEIVRAVAQTAMQARRVLANSSAAPVHDDGNSARRKTLTIISGVATDAAFSLHVAQQGIQNALGREGLAEAATMPWGVRLLYLIGVLAGVWTVLPKALYAARRLQPDMNLLMTIAVVGAIAIGEWFEAGTVAFLFSVSLLLESWSVGRARNAIARLLDLAPATVRVRTPDGAENQIAPGDVSPGTLFVVKPGERFALDGEVTEGQSHVDQSPITGESSPVTKAVGDPVFAGTINGDGALVVRSTKAAEDTTLAGIIRLVGQAQSRRAPSEQWVEKFARIYTPIVLVLAVILLVAPPLFLGAEWWPSIYNALVLLVIACPCALVISTPVSIVAAIAAAARHGVLVKGGLYIEIPARLRTLALDKTGTLTYGKPTVTEVVTLNGHGEHELIERAAALELRSEHPIAHAILNYAKEKGVTVAPAEDFQVLQGKGATGRFDGREFWLGSHRYLEERAQETPDVHERLLEMTREGRTAVVIGNDKHVCGLIALADEVRPEAANAVSALRAAGLDHLVMLSGDNEPTARAIARAVGIDDVRAELLPADKTSAIEELLAKYHQVGMIGDGVNDAPALARASLGIAMGAIGSDAAIETADVALMSDDLSRLPWLIEHSRRTLRIIRQNIAFSLAVKGVVVVFTLSGTGSLWIAIAADMGASLLVIFNGLRLLRS